MTSHNYLRRTSALVALAVAGALTLTACGDDNAETATNTSGSAAASSMQQNQPGKETESAKPGDEELKNSQAQRPESSASETTSAALDSPEALVTLEANSQLLAQVSDSIVNDSSVSQPTRDTATQLSGIIAEQQTVVSEKLGDRSGTGQTTLDGDAVNRVLNDSGSHADLAYLTLLEDNLATMSESWAALANSASADADLAEKASSGHSSR